MKTHISLNVGNLQSSILFYTKLFEQEPQKRSADYAKFDLAQPALNLSLIAAPGNISHVNHFGLEVEHLEELEEWKRHLTRANLVERVEDRVICCYAMQDKIWVVDPDGNRWEIFTIHEQLTVTQSLREAGGCCGSSREVWKGENSGSEEAVCAC